MFTIRKDDKTIARIELVIGGKSLYEVRRVKTETVAAGSVPWNLAAMVGPGTKSAAPSPARIVPDMVVSDVTVEHMVAKASFPTYVFKSDPPWTGKPQITDILDVASPPHRMFAISFVAKDGRHVVLVQAATYNNLTPMLPKLGKVVYTSPAGVKVFSGPQDKWLAGILLQSAAATIKDPPAEDRTGYFLETPAGTCPALAVNGKLTDEELHELIDSLAPAKSGE